MRRGPWRDLTTADARPAHGIATVELAHSTVSFCCPDDRPLRLVRTGSAGRVKFTLMRICRVVSSRVVALLLPYFRFDLAYSFRYQVLSAQRYCTVQ